MGCGGHEAGIQVDIQLSAFGGETWDEVQIDTLHVNVGALELVPCAPSAWRFSLLGRAYAHSKSSPLRIGVPHVVSLEQQQSGGQFLPPPGDYCALLVIFKPADADAVGLPQAAFVGRTLAVQGQTSASVFEVTSEAVQVHRITLDPPLRLSSEARQAAIEIELFEVQRFSQMLREAGEGLGDKLLSALPKVKLSQ